MESFWFPDSQCPGTLQMYHFFPGVESVTTSFPVVKGTISSAALHSSNPDPLTLNTLCAPGVYLKTAPRNQIVKKKNVECSGSKI